MLARNLISDVIPALKTSDTGQDALNWMEAFRVSHLPIVNNKIFLGLISDLDIYELNSAEEPLGNHSLSLTKPYVLEHQHIYDVMEMAARLKLSLIPVLNYEKEYLGVITQQDLLHHFSDLLAVHTTGGLLQIEVGLRDYALSEIARIVEDENSKILSLYLTQDYLLDKFHITIKLDRSDLTPIINAFERYGYNVRANYSAGIEEDDKVMRNYESLLRYLNV